MQWLARRDLRSGLDSFFFIPAGNVPTSKETDSKARVLRLLKIGHGNLGMNEV